MTEEAGWPPTAGIVTPVAVMPVLVTMLFEKAWVPAARESGPSHEKREPAVATLPVTASELAVALDPRTEKEVEKPARR